MKEKKEREREKREEKKEKEEGRDQTVHIEFCLSRKKVITSETITKLK